MRQLPEASLKRHDTTHIVEQLSELHQCALDSLYFFVALLNFTIGTLRLGIPAAHDLNEHIETRHKT